LEIGGEIGGGRHAGAVSKYRNDWLALGKRFIEQSLRQCGTVPVQWEEVSAHDNKHDVRLVEPVDEAMPPLEFVLNALAPDHSVQRYRYYENSAIFSGGLG
jgi:hypothetical protein